jgi:hypothetical protein
MPFRFLPSRWRFVAYRQPSVVGDDGWFVDKLPVGGTLAISVGSKVILSNYLVVKSRSMCHFDSFITSSGSLMTIYPLGCYSLANRHDSGYLSQQLPIANYVSLIR